QKSFGRQVSDSSDVNAYVREIACDDFTAKDFRSWAGTALAASVLAGGTYNLAMSAARAVGRSVLRKEGIEKVTGAARYIDDLSFPGMLHARTVRSTIMRGTIESVALNFDTAGFTIVDHRDIPGRNVVALIDDDQPCLADRSIRHAAEPILLIAHA